MSLCRAPASCTIWGRLFMLFDVAVPDSGLRISICCDTIIMRLLNIDTSRLGSYQRLCRRISSSCHLFARWDKVEAIHDDLQEPLISYDLQMEKRLDISSDFRLNIQKKGVRTWRRDLPVYNVWWMSVCLQRTRRVGHTNDASTGWLQFSTPR